MCVRGYRTSIGVVDDSSLPEIRLSDADRDEVIDQLSTAMSEGRLDVAEFEERSRLVYAAKVRSDLEGVVSDLPVRQTTPVRKTAGVDNRKDHRWFVSLLGDRTHRGNLVLGKQNTSVSLLGDTTFDLTQIEAEDVNLRIFSLLGDVTVFVPAGTELLSNVLVVFGDRDEDLPGPLAAESMRLNLRVLALMGDVTVTVHEV